MNKTFKNFLSTGFASLAGQFATFLITTYYANKIGAESYGKVSAAQTIWLYFCIIVFFGAQTFGVRLIATRKESLQKHMSNLLGFRLIIAAAMFLVSIVVAFVSGKGNDFAALMIIYGLCLFPTALCLDWVFNGLEEMQHNAVYILIKNLLPCLVIVLYVKEPKHMYLIPAALFAALTIASIYQFAIINKSRNIRFSFGLDRDLIKTYCHLGFPFVASGFLAMINGNSDKIILVYLYGDRELGIYMSAYIFINFFVSFSSLIFNPVFPPLIKAYNEKNKEKIGLLTENLSKIITIIVLPLTLGGIVLAKDIIEFFFKKPEYLEGALPFSILMVYIFMLYIREIFAYGLNAFNMEKIYMKIVFFSAVANLLLNIIFIPRYGMIAAAVITMVTEIINLVLMRYYAGKVAKTKILGNIIKVLPAAVVMAAVVLVNKSFNINLIINIIVAMLLYGILLIVFKVVNKEMIYNLINSRK